MLPDSNNRIERIVALAAAMLQSARARDWDAVITLEARRALELETLFAAPPSTEEAPRLARAIEQVLELDRELMALGQGTQRELAAELERAERGRQANDAYGDVLNV